MFLFTLAQRTVDDGVFILFSHKRLRTMVFLFTLAQKTEDDGVFIHSRTKD